MSDTVKMKSIWFFVALLLLTMGFLVFIAGLIEFFFPSGRQTILANTYPGIWWGVIMLIVGAFFYWKNRK
jgi:ascorbate-specific PTS system EIIC-type component UlaA